MSDALKKLQQIQKKIEKQFGEGSVIAPGSVGTERFKVESIPTGSFLLDIATGIGGLPRRGMIEIFGNESSGKTTLALSSIAQAQKLGLLTAFIDAEQSIDVEWAKQLGVDIDTLLISQPESLERALSITKALIANGVQFVVFDSVAAAPVEAEVKGEVGDQVIGVKARIMSKFTSSMLPILRANNAAILFINQVREQVGVMFGNPEVTPGGKALKFNAVMRIRLGKSEIKEEGQKIGAEITATIVKNKLSAPHKQAKLRLIYGQGFDFLYEIPEVAITVGAVKLISARKFIVPEITDEKGNPLSFSSKKAFREALEENPELLEFMQNRIRNILLGKEEGHKHEVSENGEVENAEE